MRYLTKLRHHRFLEQHGNEELLCELTGLVGHTDGDVAVDSDEYRDPDGRRLHDEDERQEVNQGQLVAVVVVCRLPGRA